MNITELLTQLYETKAKEKAIVARRIEIEEALAAQLECPEGGSKSHKIEIWKANVKRPLNRKLIVETWEEIKASIPEELHPVEYVPKLDEKGFRWLQENNPGLYRIMARAVETKPGKVAVTVERMD